MPLFMIYRPMLIPCMGEMFEKWHEWAVSYGFPGIYFIGANYDGNEKRLFQKLLIHELEHSLSALDGRNPARDGIMHYGYGDVWNEIVGYESGDENVLYGGGSADMMIPPGMELPAQ